MNSLYTRHFALNEFSDSEQQALQTAHVLIVGCGGLGNLVAMYLCTAGVGRLLINDFDSVDATNLQRQLLFAQSDIGQNKSIIAKQKLITLNSECQVEALSKRLSLEELGETARGMTAILDCSDNFATRIMLNQVSRDHSIPLISGAAIRFQGQLSVFDPEQKDSPCYYCLHQEENETVEDCAGNGILAPVTGVIASCMAVETIKLLTGIGESLVGRLQLYDAKTSQWREVKLKKDPDCPVCN